MQGNYEQTEKLLATLIAEWGNALDSMRLDPVWARVLGDPFLRQLTCRYDLSVVRFKFLFHCNAYCNDGITVSYVQEFDLVEFLVFQVHILPRSVWSPFKVPRQA